MLFNKVYNSAKSLLVVGGSVLEINLDLLLHSFSGKNGLFMSFGCELCFPGM